DVEKAAGRNISLTNLSDIISYETTEIPAGNAKEGNMELVVLSSGKPKSVNEISQLILPSESGSLYLKDIAEIKEAHAKKKSIFVYNGKAQTGLEIYRRHGADPISLSRDLKKLIGEIQKEFDADLEINLAYDAAPEIRANLINLLVSMILGAFAVTLVLLCFLRNIRYSVLAALSIPFSASAAVISLCLTGKSLNSMSLSGLALGIGLVSDTSVIILSALCRNFENKTSVPEIKNIAEETSKLSTSSFGGAATTAAVFLPVIFLPGPLGALFGELSIAIVTSVIAGWAYSQFALPVLFNLFFVPTNVTPVNNNVKPIRKNRFSNAGLRFYYSLFLRFSIRKTTLVFAAAALLSIGGFVLLLLRPASFASGEPCSQIMIKIGYPAGTKMDYIANETSIISDMLNNCDFINSVICNAGAESEDVRRRADSDYKKENVLYSCTIKSGINCDLALQQIEKLLEKKKQNALVAVELPKGKIEEILDLSSTSKFVVKNVASNNNQNNYKQEVLENIANYVEQKIELLLGNSTFVSVNPKEKRPQLKIIPLRDVEAALNVSSAQIANITGTITEGSVANNLEIDGKLFDIRVLGKNYYNSDNVNLESIPVSLGENAPVFLGTVSNIQRTEAYRALARLDRCDVLYIDISVSKENNKNFTNAINSIMKEKKELTRIDESTFTQYKHSLTITIILVLLLLYLIMGAQFESFVLPLIFMISIPLALAGAGPALTFSGDSLDFGSVLGIIVLLGIVVNNGIVLYEISEKNLQDGMNPVAAVYKGSMDRFKSVLATTLTSIIVLIPLMFYAQGSTQRSMAVAMAGGCIASTILTLFVLPPVFIFFLKGCRKNEN
ncbi:MAG: efflux RND transporter permease subunit, partial [Spirochaetaceae bacterium]|nr:efflux RND transporter permease subunit [Spirochaetaceae bacterium]